MDNKKTLEALRNLYLLQRNGDKKSILVYINLLRIENCGLIKLITVDQMLEDSRPLFMNIIILCHLLPNK